MRWPQTLASPKSKSAANYDNDHLANSASDSGPPFTVPLCPTRSAPPGPVLPAVEQTALLCLFVQQTKHQGGRGPDGRAAPTLQQAIQRLRLPDLRQIGFPIGSPGRLLAGNLDPKSRTVSYAQVWPVCFWEWHCCHVCATKIIMFEFGTKRCLEPSIASEWRQVHDPVPNRYIMGHAYLPSPRFPTPRVCLCVCVCDLNHLHVLALPHFGGVPPALCTYFSMLLKQCFCRPLL